MKKYNLIIELLSDLCVADGGVYNSLLDTDVCHDEYGLPYIPGKRIKGCLRECALELQDWGTVELQVKNDNPIEALFGKKGDSNNKSAIRISDARLEGNKNLIKEIKAGNATLYHPQNVLEQYTYIRSQTSIDSETGVARKNSLRTMRVINRGWKFIAEVESNDNVSKKLLSDICRCLRNMGLSRTRGLGEVKCELIPISEEDNKTPKKSNNKQAYNNESLLRYEIELEEPMICKSTQGGEAKSLDYIEGSKIIGLLSEKINCNRKLKEYLDSGVKFSNGYITKNSIRVTAAGAYLYRIKNDDEYYINKLYYTEKDDEQRQFSAIQNTYVIIQNNGSMVTVPVKMEERYHHSRPSDKSIGRATDTEESKFYQISSISSGQIFTGYVSGTPMQLQEIFRTLKDTEICYLGYGKGSEYGKCKFKITGYEPIGPSKRSIRTKQIVVTLNSPAIIYNGNAMYSIDKKELLAEILAALGLNENAVAKASFYINYTSVGGYNVTWGARKPMLRAFDKGTSVKLEFDEEQEIMTDSYMYIGERTAEGYGEFVCNEFTNDQTEEQWKYLNHSKFDETSSDTDTEIGELGRRIYISLLDNYIREKASELVQENNLNKESYRATVSNMLLICSEQETMKEIEAVIKDRFSKNSANKKDKSEIAIKILKAVKENYRGLETEFSAKMGVADKEYLEEEELLKKFLVQVLVESKYQIRKNALGSGQKGEADYE